MSSPLTRCLPWLAATLLVLALPALAGEVYQWKDAKGVTHYSDAPPPNQAYKNRALKQDVPAPAQVAAAPAEDPRCATARTNLERLKGNGPVGLDANGDGKPDTEMTVAERAQQTQLAELTLKTNCTPAPAKP
ncbi:MAG TPA: DUF4124 domain-containing protein [Lysobacter sp.]